MVVDRTKRSLRALVAIGVLLTVAFAAAPAGADPVGESPTVALERLAELSRKSEQTTEALHNAGIDLDAKVEAQRAADAALARDREALDAAEAELAVFRPTVDKLAVANYRGARTNRLFALMVSDSPQQLLDQMSALDVIAQDTADQVAGFRTASSAAAEAALASQRSVDEARAAAEQAQVVRDDLQRQQSELEARIDEVLAAFADLSAEEKATLAGAPFPPGFDAEKILSGLAPGSGSGALQAGMTRIGSPYSWGATGPSQFDCSGLVVWAYKQIGKNLPRSSQAQAQGGTPVPRDQLQPGDVVTFYDDASHVGLYAGNGNVLHASTYGVPVKVAPMDRMPFHNARRY
ncbi:C40 family peptidase [Rhodococcus sp. 14C212]|uniref:NlpC/P60 family protein n=1 Tax=Rhodococcus sp. 14C212 TaxID=2711209 RepID=UPI0013EC9166|nr:C40 family peptidase [Rhodococcus sp. 14C212]